MFLTEILQADCIRIPLGATSKQQAIFELVDLLADRVGIEDWQDLRDAVWQREMTRTTGIGHAMAIPHGKIDRCPRLCMAMGLTKEPIDFGAIDGKPVKLIILLASPSDQTGPHIQALAQISRLMMDVEFRSQIQCAANAQALFELIRQREGP